MWKNERSPLRIWLPLIEVGRLGERLLLIKKAHLQSKVLRRSVNFNNDEP